jgi:DNA polymerase III delta prime subunit
MAKATFVKKARKDIYQTGIRVPAKNKQGYRRDRSQPADENDKLLVAKGESYYWWAFAFGPTVISKTAPKPSQLTQSEFLAQVYDLQEEINDLQSSSTPDDLESNVQDIAERIRELGQEQEEKRDNMPEQLQDAPSGEMLQNRYDECESWADRLENADFSELEIDEDSIDEVDIDEGETKEEAVERLRQEAFEQLCEELSGESYEGE